MHLNSSRTGAISSVLVIQVRPRTKSETLPTITLTVDHSSGYRRTNIQERHFMSKTWIRLLSSSSLFTCTFSSEWIFFNHPDPTKWVIFFLMISSRVTYLQLQWPREVSDTNYFRKQHSNFSSYVDKKTAFDRGLVSFEENGAVIMKADNFTKLPKGTFRDSIRIESAKRYTTGLFILDLNRAPWGCGKFLVFSLSLCQ